jgi:hypothetical protein
MKIIYFLFSNEVWQNVWANVLFVLLSVLLFYLIFLLKKRSKLYSILGLNQIDRLTIYFSNTLVTNAIDVNGNPNLYSGPTVPENEFRTMPDLLNLLIQIGEKDNLLLRFLKFLTFGKIKVDFELSPDNEIRVEANKNSNILTIGGPGYNNATAFYQKQGVKLSFSGGGISKNGTIVAAPSMNYDYGILEKISINNQTIIIAAGFHINGTRGSVRYLINNWKSLPRGDFACLIKFPHPSRDSNGYDKPLDVAEF